MAVVACGLAELAERQIVFAPVLVLRQRMSERPSLLKSQRGATMVTRPDMPTPPAPPCTWQKKRTAPGTRNVTVDDHAALLGLPLPPTPSQPLAQRKDVMDPGSDVTLWKPPLLWNVTVSPTA